MNHRKSIPTIDNIEFIDLQPMDVNPLMSSCIIKVFYIGQNRNKSFIDKATATKMSKTLRGCPIVGHFVEEKEDFGTHGDQMIIDDNGVKFNKLTRPYGFIPTDAKIWFQFFEDTDEFGNTVVREYLCATGYLWTGQFPESKVALENQDPQSMELDPETLKGHWATDNNSGLEFFIINDAIFSALCILGEDVEPCFEGASVLPNDEMSSMFSKDSEFTQELFKMIKELNYALYNKGGTSMNEEAKTPVVEKQVTPSTEVTENVENSFSEQGESSELNTSENENITEEFKKQEEKEDSKEEKDSDSKSDDDNNKEEDEEEKKPKTKNTLEEKSLELETLQKNFDELQSKFAILEEENKSLIAFKNKVEEEQKDKLIESFYMLSEEDKKDVIANKANYSLSDIEKELSVICVRKRVNFNVNDNDSSNEEQTTPVTFNLDSHQVDSLPAWLQSVENIRNSKN